jgi:GRAM domain
MSERILTWRNALYSGLAFGLFMGLLVSIQSGWLPPSNLEEVIALAIVVLFSGSFFGLIIGLFGRSGIIPKAESIQLAPDEVVVRTGLANHFLNLEGRGGRLTLTNTHLVFMPHIANLQRCELRIPLSEIANVEATRTWGIIPNGLLISLTSGAQEKFVVNNNAAWAKLLVR